MTEDTYPNAGRESGYTDEEGKPVGENIINRVTELLLPLDVKLTLLTTEFATQTKALDTVVTTMQHIAATVVSIASAQKKIKQQIKESQEDRQAIHNELAEVKADVVNLSERFDNYAAGSKRSQLDDVARDVEALKAWRASLEAREGGQ